MAGAPSPLHDPLTVAVDTGTSRYDILIGERLLADPRSWAGLPRSRDAVVVTNGTVAPLWLAPAREATVQWAWR